MLLEIRQQYSFYGVLLYVGATIFVLFMVIPLPEAAVWNGLFWTLQLFISINAVAKSFLQESRGRMIYYTGLVSPQTFILAKLAFNAVLMLIMGLLSFLLFSMFLGFPLQKALLFGILVLLGGFTLSLVFSFLAAIAARAGQNAAIMAILGFPILIPQLLIMVQASMAAYNSASAYPLINMGMLLVSDLMVVLLSLILFPFIWKD